MIFGPDIVSVGLFLGAKTPMLTKNLIPKIIIIAIMISAEIKAHGGLSDSRLGLGTAIVLGYVVIGGGGGLLISTGCEDLG